jgi:CheY-like chemotaxis protein
MVLIAQTGWAQQEEKQRAMEAAFDFHLTKPINWAEVTNLIRMKPASEQGK